MSQSEFIKTIGTPYLTGIPLSLPVSRPSYYRVDDRTALVMPAGGNIGGCSRVKGEHQAEATLMSFPCKALRSQGRGWSLLAEDHFHHCQQQRIRVGYRDTCGGQGTLPQRGQHWHSGELNPDRCPEVTVEDDATGHLIVLVTEVATTVGDDAFAVQVDAFFGEEPGEEVTVEDDAIGRLIVLVTEVPTFAVQVDAFFGDEPGEEEGDGSPSPPNTSANSKSLWPGPVLS
jgi:hypothetical protein